MSLVWLNKDGDKREREEEEKCVRVRFNRQGGERERESEIFTDTYMLHAYLRRA